MFLDFVLGIKYVIKGCKTFYQDKKMWRFTIVPIAIMCVFYIVAIWGIFYVSHIGAEQLIENIQKLPNWCSWMSYVVDWGGAIFALLFVIILLSTTICTFYEFFGGLCFDVLVEHYEKRTFNISVRKITWRENLRYIWSSLIWGVYVVIIFCFLFIFSLFFPIIGQIILVGVMGYCFGVSYMICSANNNKVSITQLKLLCFRRILLVMGFGIAVYLLSMIPFAVLFLLPGFVLGGSELFNNQLKKEVV